MNYSLQLNESNIQPLAGCASRQETYVTECTLGCIKTIKALRRSSVGRISHPPGSSVASEKILQSYITTPCAISQEEKRTECRNTSFMLGCSVTQDGIFFKRTFFKKGLIFEKNVKIATKMLQSVSPNRFWPPLTPLFFLKAKPDTNEKSGVTPTPLQKRLLPDSNRRHPD